jgi:glycosyltransferase involved in cell wall biosynthesis
VPKRWWGFVGKARLLERDLVFLHPARLVRRKAIELSLEVVAALRAAGKDVALLITAPEDPHQSAGAVYREELLRLRERLNLEREALFLNEVAPLEADDLSAFYELADAILFPSTQEGFGLPMLEAALHRVPIFCREIEPMTGLPSLPGTFFAPAASAEEVAAHLMRTLASSGTMKMRKQVIQTYGWAAIYRKCIAPLLQERLNFNRP